MDNSNQNPSTTSNTSPVEGQPQSTPETPAAEPLSTQSSGVASTQTAPPQEPQVVEGQALTAGASEPASPIENSIPIQQTEAMAPEAQAPAISADQKAPVNNAENPQPEQQPQTPPLQETTAFSPSPDAQQQPQSAGNSMLQGNIPAKNSSLKMIIIALAVLILIVGGYFAYQYFTSN